MTAKRVDLVQTPDGSWKRPDCECEYHFWDGKPLVFIGIGQQHTVTGIVAPHVHFCDRHRPGKVYRSNHVLGEDGYRRSGFLADGSYEELLVCGHVWRRTAEQVERGGRCIRVSYRRRCLECEEHQEPGP